jgi:hypothetical protein
LLDFPVSCKPSLEFTKVFDAPVSNIVCVIASSTALALSCSCSFLVRMRSCRHALFKVADATINRVVDMTTFGRSGGFGSSGSNNLLLGGGVSPVVTR